MAVAASDAEATVEAPLDENHPAQGTTTNFVLPHVIHATYATVTVIAIVPAPGLENATRPITCLLPPTPTLVLAPGPAAPSAVDTLPLLLLLILLLPTTTIRIVAAAAVVGFPPSLPPPLRPIMTTMSTTEAPEEEEVVLALHHPPAMLLLLLLLPLLRTLPITTPMRMHTHRRRLIMNTAPAGSGEGQDRITTTMSLLLPPVIPLLVMSTMIDEAALLLVVLLVVPLVVPLLALLGVVGILEEDMIEEQEEEEEWEGGTRTPAGEDHQVRRRRCHLRPTVAHMQPLLLPLLPLIQEEEEEEEEEGVVGTVVIPGGGIGVRADEVPGEEQGEVVIGRERERRLIEFLC